jgi:hypothetical protein
MSTFQTTLAAEYRALFATDPRYATVAGTTTPEALAETITAGLRAGRKASKEGAGVKRTCRLLGIKPTFQAIEAYLAAEA